MGTVSVIIPTYNRGKTILRALQSVLNQTYTNIEVLIIDDCSNDDTAEIVKSVSDKRVRYIQLEQNGGPAKARNVGAQMASGEWIAFQDSDDYWYPDKLEKQILYACEHPNYSMLYCICNTIFLDGHSVLVPVEPWPEVMEGDLLRTLLIRNVMDTPTMFVKRSDFLDVGGFAVGYKALEDWEYAIRFAKKYQIGFVPEILMDGYMLSDGVSSNLGAYFESRCKILSTYRCEMMKEGLFDVVVQDIFSRAQTAGVLESVKKIMMLYLSK